MRNCALCLIVISAGVVWAQGPGTTSSASQPVRPIGVVTQLQPGKLILHTDAGLDLLVVLPDGVSVVRVPPGAKDLSAASKINVTDLSTGDRILVRGRASDDGKSIQAATVIVMTKTDLTSAREAERLIPTRRRAKLFYTAIMFAAPDR